MKIRLKWLQDFFVKNRQLKLLAVFLAALTFYAIRGATSFEVSYDVPVEVKVERGIAILDQDTKTVHVMFRGSREDIRTLDQSSIKAVVQPKAINPAGSETVPVGPRDIDRPSGLRVASIRPSSVKLTFDREAVKKVRVEKPKTIGRPLAGRISIEYEPQWVTISGPKRRLADKTRVVTESVNVDGRVESFTKQVKVLSLGDTWVSGIDPSEITVKVNIVTESVTRSWTNVAVLAALKPGTLKEAYLEPSVVNVHLQGRAEAIDRITDSAIKVFVDCADLDVAATYELPVNIHLPAGVDVEVSVTPETVKVGLKEEPAEEPAEKLVGESVKED